MYPKSKGNFCDSITLFELKNVNGGRMIWRKGQGCIKQYI